VGRRAGLGERAAVHNHVVLQILDDHRAAPRIKAQVAVRQPRRRRGSAGRPGAAGRGAAAAQLNRESHFTCCVAKTGAGRSLRSANAFGVTSAEIELNRPDASQASLAAYIGVR
jgi:hypothetical protein